MKYFKYIFEDYGIKPRRTTIKNPQDNSILERVHQVLGNMLRCKNISNLDLEGDDPWTALLSSPAFSMIETHHTTIGASPDQVGFGRYIIHPHQDTDEWDLIKSRNQKGD